MNNLKKRREELHLTQKEVAERVGIAEQQYQRYEKDTSEPRIRMVLKIAKALETTAEELYTS